MIIPNYFFIFFIAFLIILDYKLLFRFDWQIDRKIVILIYTCEKVRKKNVGGIEMR